jgi:hypothetical protein
MANSDLGGVSLIALLTALMAFLALAQPAPPPHARTAAIAASGPASDDWNTPKRI